jgi:hypothetical protein
MSKLRKLSRVAVALGGLLIFVGTIMIAISVLAFYDVTNAAIDSEQGKLFMWVLLIISLLNLASGILLLYRRR